MTWQTQHQLETVVITYRLPDVRTGAPAAITAHGRSSTKRANLWTHHEEWDPEDTQHEGYEPSDLARHLLLVAEQDRPNSAERLAFGLSGGLSWTEEEFPWPE